MTKEEAIEKLKREKVIMCNGCMHPQMIGWCEDHCQMPEAINMAIEALHKTKWILVNERLPEEHEWIGTKKFGTTISDKVLVTFDVDGTRFVKPLSLQNRKLSRPDAQTMDVFHKGWKMLAWMPLPEPYREDGGA